MAEARRATILMIPNERQVETRYFTLTNFKIIYNTIKDSWSHKIFVIKNRFHNGIYPMKPDNSIYIIASVFTLSVFGIDPSFGIIEKIEIVLQSHLHLKSPRDHIVAAFGFSIGLWLTMGLARKSLLHAMLTYHGWMYESRGHTRLKTKLWFLILTLIESSRDPKLYSYQSSLPCQPLPKLKDTLRRYLRSMKPLKSASEFKRLTQLATEFENRFGFRTQLGLYIKYLISPNYVTDWWEQFIYLSSRSPLMVNSNYYGMDALFISHHWLQQARAANLVCAAIQVRNLINTEDFPPIILQKTVPLCSSQYIRMFGTTRIPGFVKNYRGQDRLCQFQDSNHIVVIHKGRFFKCLLYFNGRKLEPVDVEEYLQSILDNKDPPEPHEEFIPILTAGERNHWASTREKYFKTGINKLSLDCIETASFILILESSEGDFDPTDEKKLDNMAHALIHGKGYDRWFDKTFNMIVFHNGRAGFNAEHSWADAPIVGHMWEYILLEDVLSRNYGYTPDGHCRGIPYPHLPPVERLKWEISTGLVKDINVSMEVVNKIINDLDMHVFVHNNYGKGFMKKCKVSPDAYIQFALQLTYYRLNNEFCQTYESSMTRLFLEGRTETVRSCSSEVCEAVTSMDNNRIPTSTKILYFRHASEYHQKLYRDAMTGKGVDRHLFCMYVMCKILNIESEFLVEVLTQPWKLSTSQTPLGQTKHLDLSRYPNFISAGGGFGPVADDGYGVSYIIAGEDRVFFHISSKFSCKKTSSKKFADTLLQSLSDIKEMFQKEM